MRRSIGQDSGSGLPLDTIERTLLEHVPAVLYVELPGTGASNRWWSAGIVELTGHPVEDFGRDHSLWSSIRVDPMWHGSLGAMLASRGREEFRIRRLDGNVRRVREEWRLTGSGMRCGVLLDVTDDDTTLDRAVSPRGVRSPGTKDPLTGLHDRRSLQRRIQRVLVRRAPAAILLLDLDRFREINDTLGHSVGDRLLVAVSRRLQDAVRPVDTVARFGGDEFAILMPSTDADDGMEAARSMEQAIGRPFAIDGQLIAISASIGVTTGSGTAERLLTEADQAMMTAKHERRGIVLFDPAFQDDSGLAGYSRLPELRRAIEEGQLVLHYQPWLCLTNGRSDVVEALVRWQHPDRGLLPPAEFLPLAEASGLIRDIDVYVLEMACRQAVAWREAGLHLRLAVNLSRPSLLSEEFPSILAAALIRHRLEGPELELEITENGVLGDPEQAAWLAERLTALGVRLSIDDFGTGYSSLGQLRRMGVSTLKVDRSFVSDLLASEDDRAIVETVVALGHRLGLIVVAEGVEDEATMTYLRTIGVDYGQGYVISRPIPPAQLIAWLAARSAVPVEDERDGTRIELVKPAPREETEESPDPSVARSKDPRAMAQPVSITHLTERLTAPPTP